MAIIFFGVTVSNAVLYLIVAGLYNTATNQEQIMIHLGIKEAPVEEEPVVKEKIIKLKLDSRLKALLNKERKPIIEKPLKILDEVFYVESIDKTVLVIKKVSANKYLCKDTDSNKQYQIHKDEFI